MCVLDLGPMYLILEYIFEVLVLVEIMGDVLMLKFYEYI